MKNIVLCGMPGAGKTTVGAIVASMLEVPFIDTDVMIEKRCGVSCREHYLSVGEREFRKLEGEVITSIPAAPAQVIALGGGALETKEVRDYVARLGVLVYIDESIETLATRKLIPGSMPAFSKTYADFVKIYEQRSCMMKSLSDVYVNANELDPQGVAEAIMIQLRGE